MDRQRRNKRDPQSILIEFPDDFDDLYYHTEMLKATKEIDILRNVVYKRVKEAVISRVKSQTPPFALVDRFVVTMDTGDYSNFSWAVIREDLMKSGFEADFEFDESKSDVKTEDESTKTEDDEEPAEKFRIVGKITKINIVIERKIALTGPLQYDSDNEEESDNE
jgi:hypothetical protein